MKYVNKQILNALDNASRNSVTIDSSQLYRASFLVRFNGAAEDAVGNLVVQVSNDIPPAAGQPAQNFTVTNWATLSTTVVSSGDIAKTITADITYRWIRIIYTRTSGGTGSVVCDFFALGV